MAVQRKPHDASGVFANIDPSVRYVGNATRPDEASESGADERTLLRTAAGKNIYVYETPDSIWLDVGGLAEGGGNAAYAAVDRASGHHIRVS